jgi:hypothetical protein
MSLRAVASHSDVATTTLSTYQNRSSEIVGKYSPSSCRFHHAPVSRCSSLVVNLYR